MTDQERLMAYDWLIKLLRKSPHGLTREEISNYWRNNTDLSSGNDLPVATFKRWRHAILDIYKIDIRCEEKSGYRYVIGNRDDVGRDMVHKWMMRSVAIGRTLSDSQQIYDRILIEPTPSDLFLDVVISAMNKSVCVVIDYQEYDETKAQLVRLEPYCLKTYHHRWYLLGKKTDGTMQVYGLDRVNSVAMTKESFRFDPTFDAEYYFSEYYGVRLDNDVPLERVVIRAHHNERHIFRRQPIHHSQRLIAECDEYCDYEYRLRPTFDFVSYLESQGRFVEVIKPEWLRKELVRVHTQAIDRNACGE